MQVKTQLLIEDIIGWLAVIAVVCAWLYSTQLEDEEVESEMPVKSTIDVHVKQVGGINHVVYRECVLLAERVTCG